MTSSALPKSRLLLLCGLTASIGLATALPAVGQSGDDPVQVSLVPQDFSDCSNANVKANGGETPGGTVVLVRRNDGSIDLKVGITAAGSGTDILALWAIAEHKVQFTRVPLGGGGLVPNLLTGNIDATVLYSPLTFKVADDKVARTIIDFGQAVPEHSTGSWIATDKVIKERPDVVKVVSWAAGNGDRSENGDYIYGKKRLREIDRRVRYLSKRLANAEVVDSAKRAKTAQVFFGATVTTANAKNEERTVKIVGVDEVDLAKGHVSWISPIAKALMRAEEGDVVRLRTPVGVEELEIVKVDYF